MPYKDPERKRQWEREHREERNAQRRKSVASKAPDHYAVTTDMNNHRDSDSAKMIALAHVLFSFYSSCSDGSFLADRKPLRLFKSFQA